jgi:hypothetical protein
MTLSSTTTDTPRTSYWSRSRWLSLSRPRNETKSRILYKFDGIPPSLCASTPTPSPPIAKQLNTGRCQSSSKTSWIMLWLRFIRATHLTSKSWPTGRTNYFRKEAENIKQYNKSTTKQVRYISAGNVKDEDATEMEENVYVSIARRNIGVRASIALQWRSMVPICVRRIGRVKRLMNDGRRGPVK